MKNTFKLFGIIAVIVVIGFSFASCGDNGGGGYTPTAGLYRGVLPNLVAADRVAGVAANNVAAAIEYANENPGTFTLLVGAPVTHAGAALTLAEHVHLTIAGIGGRQTITRSGNGILFSINGANRFLTLGNDITLAGHGANTTPVVSIGNGGSLTMNAGAWITDNSSTANNSAAAVSLLQEVSTFTMLGGEIRGNVATGTGSNGGVRINAGIFRIVNGVIFGGNEGVNSNTGTSYNALEIVSIGTATLGTMVGGVFTPTLNAEGEPVTLSNTNNTVRVVNGVLQ